MFSTQSSLLRNLPRLSKTRFHFRPVCFLSSRLVYLTLLLSSVKSCTTLCDPMNRQASLFITNSWSLLKLMSIESLMPSNHLIFCHPLLLLPSIFPSIRVFSNQSVLRIRWPKHWSFGFSISPPNEYSRLISFRMDWCDLAVQGTLQLLFLYCYYYLLFSFSLNSKLFQGRIAACLPSYLPIPNTQEIFETCLNTC